MKSILLRLAFLPFALAILLGAKLMWQKLFAATPEKEVPAIVIQLPSNPTPAALVETPPAPAPVVTPAPPKPKKDEVARKAAPDGTKVQVALLLDISGSMSGLISQAKTRLWQVVNELAKAKINGSTPSLEIALYAYGGDHLPSNEGYIQELTAFTNDLDLISEKLFALGTNGGEEYCGYVIQTASLEQNWSKNKADLKMIFIAGNEPFSQGPIDYKGACNAAREKGIVINTIFCGAYQEGMATNWKHGADLNGGQYLSIDHNHEVADIATPYDSLFTAYNAQLNATYIYHGSNGWNNFNRQQVQDQNAMSGAGYKALCNRATSKSSGFYQNSWDLVDAKKSKEFKWEEVEKETLPEAYKELSTDSLKVVVEQKEQERAEIQSEINKLTQLRNQFLQENQTKSKAQLGLDEALVKCLRSQGEKKGYEFD